MHPLITDDAFTQGLGHVQIEVNGAFSHFDEDGVRNDVLSLNTFILSYGITGNTDVVLTIPYFFVWTKENGKKDEADGFSDMSAEVKWRFYEKNGLSLAFKPGVSFPTGDDEKGLGTGRVGYRFFFIASEELEGLAFHFNLGYIRNENTLGQKLDLWHISLAAEKPLTEKWTVAGNIGMDRDPEGGTPPAFILAGAIYSIVKDLDVDAGLKAGLDHSAEDYALLFGITKRF